MHILALLFTFRFSFSHYYFCTIGLIFLPDSLLCCSDYLASHHTHDRDHMAEPATFPLEAVLTL